MVIVFIVFNLHQAVLGTGDGVAVWLVLGLIVEAVHLGWGDHCLVVSHSHRKKTLARNNWTPDSELSFYLKTFSK